MSSMSATKGFYDADIDVIDSRDINERIDYLKSINEGDEELAILLGVKADTGSEEYFDQGITFIADSYWSEYAEEEFYTAYSIKSDISNIWYYVDWNKWENDLQMDYASIDIDGNEYYYR